MAHRISAADLANNQVNGALLISLADDLDRVFDTRKELNERAGEIYERARAGGISPPVLRKMVAERRMDDEARHALYALQDQYRKTLGMYADTPLGAATVEREAAEAAGTDGSARRADAMAEALKTGNDTTKTRRKPFAEQPLGRHRGRPPRNSAARVFAPPGSSYRGDDDLPPAA